MNSFPAMEWNTKWDWENIVMLNSKEGESAKKFQPTDWGIEEVVDIDAGSFNLSGGVGGSGGSGSDLGHVSSARSSISVSTDSLSKEGLKTSKFTFEAFESFCGDFGKKEELPKDEIKGSSPQLSSLVGSGEPLIGLKLGKRTYFENNCASNNATASSPAAISASSTVTTKKLKASCLNGPVPRCQVEGCNLDLSSTKEYYWKHRVCENHSKSPKVVIGGVERRFCQQCSRFHGLLEFDEKKRSCRKRLSDHNARRRKPQQETIPFNSTRLSSSIYDVQQQLNFVLNDFPVVQSRPPATNSVWESCASDSKFTLTRDYHVKPEENIIVDRQPHLPAIQLPRHYSNRVLPTKTASAEVLNQDMKEPVFPGGAAPDYCRALSLLSTTTNCWGSCEELESPTLHHHHPMHENGNTTTLPFHAVSQGLLLPPASPEYWQHTNQHSTIPPQSHQLHHHTAAAANPNTITGFKEFQIFRDSRFYSKN